MGNIWCVGAGEPSSRPAVTDANSGNPMGLLVLHLLGGGIIKLDV